MDLPEWLTDLTGLALVRVLIAVVAGVAVVWLVHRLVPWVLQATLRTSMDRLDRLDLFEEQVEEQLRRRVITLTGFITRVSTTLTTVVVAVYTLSVAGIRLEPIIAGAGVAGVAIAFGAQTLVRDAISGIFLIIENPYNIGDYVRLNTLEGEVVAISLRRTTLRGDDGTEHTIPNGAITQTSNFSGRAARHAMTVRVSADVPLEQVVEAVDAVALALAQAPEVAEEVVDGPIVRGITAWRSDSYDVEIRTLMRRTLRRRWPFLLNRQLMRVFAERGIRVL